MTVLLTATPPPLDLLSLARRVADYADALGFVGSQERPRPAMSHLGAVLADCALQAGVNHHTVVRPRVERIIVMYPESATLAGTRSVVEAGAIREFLMWKHADKVERFIGLYSLLRRYEIDRTAELRRWLLHGSTRHHLLSIRGVGPKTVDYLGCLIGIDSIAVDRHVIRFSKRAGIEIRDYHVLRSVFCCAADLLGASRRSFDAWVWATQREHSAVA